MKLKILFRANVSGQGRIYEEEEPPKLEKK